MKLDNPEQQTTPRYSQEEATRLIHELQERNKELQLLHQLAILPSREGHSLESQSLEATLQDIVDLIPPAWQYPKDTCSRIIFGDLEATSANFQRTEWKQSARIETETAGTGVVEVYYLKPKPECDEGPFLKEERILLESLSKQTGRIIERFAAKRSLQAANQQLDAANQQLEASNQQLEASNQQLDATNQQLAAANQQLEAANQQLAAANQQLAATNQQVEAANQQLRATEQQLRASNRRLKDSEERFRHIYEHMTVGVARVSLDMRIEHANESYCDMLGYKEQELIGRHLRDITQPEVRAQNLKRQAQLVAGEIDHFRMDKTFIHKDGHVVYGILDACLVRDHRGQPAYCLGSVVDISKRKQTEQALRRRLAYEHLVAEITASVVRVNDIAQFQEECVAELGKTIGVSRVYIFEHHAAQNTMSNTHEWCGAGITPQKVTLQDVPGDAAQWWIETLKRDEIICYADIEQIPDEATKAILRPQNIQSVLVVPIFVGGKYYGFLGFDECAEQRQWPAEDIEILKSITQILSAAIMRARVEQALVRRRNELETLYQGARDVLTGSEFETIARRIFAGAQKITGAQSGYVALLSASGAENELLFLESGGLPCTVDPNLPMPIRGLRAEAYASGEVVWENDFSNSRWAEYMPDGHVALRNVLFAPLRIGEQTVGVIGLANKPTDFDENDRNIAAAMGQLAALGLQRWRAEEATRAERDRLQGVMQTVPVAIMIADDRQCIIQTNRAAAQIFGRSDLSTAKCARCGDIIACAHRKDVNKGCGYAKRCASCEVYRAIKDGLAGKTIDGLETEIEIRRQGKTTRRQILLSAAPLRIGNQAGVILAAKDITEIRKLHAKIAQADRLSSMGMLAAGVAHEINNPLAYTLYNLESLTEDLPPLLEDLRDLHVRLSSPDPVTTKEAQDLAQTLKPSTLTDIHSRLKETLEGTHRIRDITHGLSTFSRVERDTLVPVDLAHVIDVAVNMAFNEIKYRARLIKDYGRTPPILASEGRLSQVFLNLFINASHAIEVGDVEHNEIRIHTWSNDAFVYAEVRDSGSGIAPENLDRLFEPFFSTKAIGKGSGLGLSISKNIVEGYGGTISVESELGSGTRFLVALPIRKQIVPPKKKQPAATAQVTTGRVLLVDDEPAIRKTMARMLREHETVQAANGTEARKILEQDSAFDLILCDMMMPDFSGMDLHQWLIQTHPRLAKNFIFITGGAFTPHARQYLSEVENLRLKKPFDVKNFRKIVSDQIIIAKRKKVSGTSD